MSVTTAQIVKLKSADGVTFEVDQKVAEKSTLIKHMIDDLGIPEDAIELENVQSNVLRKVLEFCEHHKNDPPFASTEEGIQKARASEISQWDYKFLQVDQELLFETILAANYMEITPLLEVSCRTVAGMIKSKDPAEIRRQFNIQNDFTPEEEDQIRRDHEWAQDR